MADHMVTRSLSNEPRFITRSLVLTRDERGEKLNRHYKVMQLHLEVVTSEE